MITHKLAAGLFLLAGVIFSAASMVSAHKGHSDDSFRSAMWAIGSLLVAVFVA